MYIILVEEDEAERQRERETQLADIMINKTVGLFEYISNV
jgi:hypothetical protein